MGITNKKPGGGKGGDTVDVHVVAFRQPIAHSLKEVEELRCHLPLIAVLQRPIRGEKGVLHAFGCVLFRGVGQQPADRAAVPLIPPCVENSRPKP